MARKNSNAAIDFTRLFAMKDQLARQGDLPVGNIAPALIATPLTSIENDQPRTHSTESGEVIGEAANTEVGANIGEQQPDDSVLVAATANDPTRESDLLTAASRASVQEGTRETFLRIGMSRSLHARIRAFSSLNARSPTALVRELFERVTPEFDLQVPMADLAAAARAAVPTVSRERRVDIRMQVPVTEHLHRRLQQFAALRGQTLGSSMLDVLEAHAPGLI